MGSPQHAANGADYDAIINVQATCRCLILKHCTQPIICLENPAVDIATFGVEIKDEAEKTASQVTKAVFDLEKRINTWTGAVFFAQPCSSGNEPLYHHVGLYVYRRISLERFVKSRPSPLELREKLEQLRALALGMHIEVGVIDTVPMGVDTPEDLEMARKLLARQMTKKLKLRFKVPQVPIPIWRAARFFQEPRSAVRRI